MIQDDSLSNLTKIWDLVARTPSPQIIARAAVNDSTWTEIHRVPEGTHAELKELLIYNGDSSTRQWRVAFLNDTEAAPSGTSLDLANVFLSGELATGASIRLELSTGLFPKWRVYAFSTAASSKHLNMCLSGIMRATQ